VTQHNWGPEIGIRSLPEKKDKTYIPLTPKEHFITDWKTWREAQQSENIQEEDA